MGKIQSRQFDGTNNCLLKTDPNYLANQFILVCFEKCVQLLQFLLTFL